MEKLTRTAQCKNCPWKVHSNLAEIPNYNRQQHENLEQCIAVGECDLTDRPIMSCHESQEEKPEACIGYLHNQLQGGNAVGLRLKVRTCPNINEIKVVGKQFDNFKDTLR